MNIKNKSIKNLTLGFAFCVVCFSCQKMEQPALPSDYPQDIPVVPSTDLRFFLPFDSTSEAAKQLNIRFADSISSYPSFFPDPSTKAVPGVTGTAYQGSLGTFIHYLNANDWGNSTSFTISLWMNIMLSQKDHTNADGILAVSNTKNFWGNVTIYADHEDSEADSMRMKFVFAVNDSTNNWDFAGYDGDKRWPGMYDGQWHHVVFVYDATSKTGTVYRDGVQVDQKTNETIVFGNASQVVVGGFQEAVGIYSTYDKNTWMSGFPGAIDQIRLYNTALSASDVQGLYNSRQ